MYPNQSEIDILRGIRLDFDLTLARLNHFRNRISYLAIFALLIAKYWKTINNIEKDIGTVEEFIDKQEQLNIGE